MSSFAEKIGKMTVEEAKVLNEASKIIAKYNEEK